MALNAVIEDMAQWAVTWMKPKGAEWVDPASDDAADLAPDEKRQARR